MSAINKDGSCTNCGSTSVVWRRRRFYDVLLTWLGASLSNAPLWAGDCFYWSDELPPEAYLPVSLETPRRFWRCTACSQTGEEFDGDSNPVSEDALAAEPLPAAAGSVSPLLTLGWGSGNEPDLKVSSLERSEKLEAPLTSRR